MTQRILTALAYAVVAVVAALQTGLPTTTEGWIGMVVLAVTTFWGKFSSNTTLIAPSRAAWTEQERKQEALDALNKGL